jgi:hypothetical protein
VDDEDDIGSGELEREVEGSANSVDFHTTQSTISHKSSVTESNLIEEPNNYDEKSMHPSQRFNAINIILNY